MTITRDSTRQFDGKTYYYEGWAKTKARADEASDYFRKNNYLVRVIPAPEEGYYIFKRKKDDS